MTEETHQPELSPTETLYHLERDFVMLATMNTNHLNQREVKLALERMEEAGMWFQRALDKHHKPTANNSTSATQTGAI